MKQYNLRTYALIINDRNQILLSDEFRFGKAFTKFPGGGLEWGEGLKDGLKREIQEEIGLDAEIGDLFYVNDFFQESAFRSTDQLISFYFKVSRIAWEEIPISIHSVPLDVEGEKFRWIDINALNPDILTFPIDKIVANELLRHDFG